MMRILILLLIQLFAAIGYAQTDTLQKATIVAVPGKEDKPLKYSLNDDGTHWFQVTFLNQTWARYNQSNPGTKLDGEDAPETFDLGLRRTRIQMFGQITDRTFVYFQFGSNNVNAHSLLPGETNRKVQAFFHDALCEYNVFKGKNWMKLGGGLTITNGLSRFSQPSIGTIATLDVPVFLQATVDQTDEFSRKMSIYVRGQIGKWDYRFSLSDPYPIANSGNPVTLKANSATFAGYGHHKQYQSYIMYQFFDKEGHNTPYMTGSYLGKKKVLNVGAGVMYQSKATWYQDSTAGVSRTNTAGIPIPTASTKYNDMLLMGVEVFYESPLNKEKGTALSLFGGFFSMDYGKNYLRMNGLMNPVGAFGATNSNGSLNGAGNAYPMFGTGNHVYLQVAYLFKKDLLGDRGTIQPFATVDIANYQALNQPMQVFDAGFNWLINGHKSKISLDYQLRPVYGLDQKISSRASSVILQYQIFI
jgi:hypothetical protein